MIETFDLKGAPRSSRADPRSGPEMVADAVAKRVTFKCKSTSILFGFFGDHLRPRKFKHKRTTVTGQCAFRRFPAQGFCH